MRRTLKAAVIGTGFIGPVHIEALRRLGIEVTGVLSSSKEQGQAKADALRLPKAYGSIDELLAEPGLDCVHITTPNYLHKPMVEAAIAAGKHVVCEKPLAMDTAEGAVSARSGHQSAGIVHAVNFNFRFYPMCRQAKAMNDDGDSARSVRSHGRYVQDWLFNDTDWNWRLEADLGGDMRAVSDIGSHWLDLTRFITGQRRNRGLRRFRDLHSGAQEATKPIGTFDGMQLRPGRIRNQTRSPPRTTPASCSAIRDGAHGVVTVSQIAAGRKNHNSVEIDGSNCSVAWNSERVEELWIGHRDRPSEVFLKDPSLMSAVSSSRVAEVPGGHAEGFRDTFKMLYARVYAAIEAGGPPDEPDYPTFADGVYALKLGDAILQSARERRWITV